MNTDTFDADAFVQDAIDGALDTQYAMVPVGEYDAIIQGIDKPRVIEPADPSKQAFGALNVTFELVNVPQAVLDEVGRSPLTVRYDLLLDLNDQRKLDVRKGKNVRLGKLREAVGQNTPGKPWSFTNLVGAGPVRVYVDHDQDKKDPEKYWERVKRVAKIA